MTMDGGAAGRPDGKASTSRRRRTAGGDLIMVCGAALAPGSGGYLAELGLGQAEIEHAPAVARRVLAQEATLSLVYSAVGVGRLIGAIADALDEPAQVQALDALLDVAELYVPDHDARLEQYRWSSRVLPRLSSLPAGEPARVSPAGRLALFARGEPTRPGPRSLVRSSESPIERSGQGEGRAPMTSNCSLFSSRGAASCTSRGASASRSTTTSWQRSCVGPATRWARQCHCLP
jgi:hypothetical protein